MDDLLASIRKIIADDVAERPRPQLRVTPPLNREPYPPRRATEVDDSLSALVEQAMADAFGVADSDGEEPQRRAAIDGNASIAMREGGEGDVQATVHTIAEAIAAERQVRSRRAEAGQGAGAGIGAGVGTGDWSGAVLGEPGLDAAAPPRSLLRPQRAPLATGAPGRPGSLRPRPESADVTAAGSFRLDAGKKPAEATGAAMDPKVQDGDAAFRRPVSAAAGRAGPEDRLTSARTRQTMSSQLDELSRTVISNNPRTLEDLVRDMVRPLLREWLEANLPAIVERQVRQEIDRLSHSGR